MKQRYHLIDALLMHKVFKEETCVFYLFLVVFALTGCSGTTIGGNEDKLTPAYLKQHLIVGKTTKAEVRQYFGAPILVIRR
jgi:hypothetical protein